MFILFDRTGASLPGYSELEVSFIIKYNDIKNNEQHFLNFNNWILENIYFLKQALKRDSFLKKNLPSFDEKFKVWFLKNVPFLRPNFEIKYF